MHRAEQRGAERLRERRAEAKRPKDGHGLQHRRRAAGVPRAQATQIRLARDRGATGQSKPERPGRRQPGGQERNGSDVRQTNGGCHH
jgi:hypothetical protein